jgi:hypothetical protein
LTDAKVPAGAGARIKAYFARLTKAFAMGFDAPVRNRNDALKMQLAHGASLRAARSTT